MATTPGRISGMEAEPSQLDGSLISNKGLLLRLIRQAMPGEFDRWKLSCKIPDILKIP